MKHLGEINIDIGYPENEGLRLINQDPREENRRTCCKIVPGSDLS
jgi:hypothetical protein